MTERDVEAMARLRVAAFFESTARTPDEDAAGLRMLLPGDGFETALVARIGDVSVGTCLLVRHELEPAHKLTPWLAGLVVDDAYRGRGIGRALVAAIEAYAASIGVQRLYLYTWEARDFYAGLGWVVVEQFEQEGGAMLLMAREIQL
ncbi:GNAT family N-acetyltransferase [Mesorhizobium sp.]|uniref:GNAT family N-acetyltransferase n=1 Tax=Mesorhizobium sp. TaxID=1871066 RepID=UPI0025E6A6CA|nr:GNAT family N-acetyltransferase [Mesorhizobium sp.]